MSNGLELSYDKKLFYTTTKIENHTMNGTVKHSTGFLYNYKMSDGKVVRTILTCKHSIKDFARIDLHFCLDNGNAEPLDKIRFTMSYAADTPLIVPHPDKDVDLVSLIFSYDKKIFIAGNKQPFYLSLDDFLIPTQEQLNELSYIEDVLMIGYPQSIWDEYNNKPVVRKGITASPIQFDFNGKKQFLLDIASYHGSSGSPVFIFNPSPHFEKNSIKLKNQIYLLGMFFGGWEEVTQGTVQVTAVEKKKKEEIILELALPNNIGYVLKSSVFAELKDLIEQRITEVIIHKNL